VTDIESVEVNVDKSERNEFVIDLNIPPSQLIEWQEWNDVTIDQIKPLCSEEFSNTIFAPVLLQVQLYGQNMI
jgi:hypothetical protein